MNRKIFYFIIFVLFLFPLTAWAKSSIVREKIFSAIVQVVGINEEGDVFIGSGSTIRDDGLLLTNYHVVTDDATDEPYSSLTLCYTVSDYQAPRCAASGKVLARNKDFDLALILPDKKIGKDGKVTSTSFQKYWNGSGQKFSTLPFKNDSAKNSSASDSTLPLPHILDRITVWGYPSLGGATITIASGYVSGFESEKIGEDVDVGESDFLIRFIKTDAEISHGNSGGAVLNEQMNFIGVPTRAFPGQLGFIIPLHTVKEWFLDLEKQGIFDPSTSWSFNNSNLFFSDLAEDDELNDKVQFLRHFYIMKGMASGRFEPENNLTYAEALKIVTSASTGVGVPGTCCITPPCFSGLDMQAWYSQYACYAFDKGWISARNFNPYRVVNEVEFMDLLHRAFGKKVFRRYPSEPITRGAAAERVFEFLVK